jgi:RNA-directed DNA polymerase
VHGNEADVGALREDIADVLAPLRLRLSEAKTRIMHMGVAVDQSVNCGTPPNRISSQYV